jgi:hypothetical protein
MIKAATLVGVVFSGALIGAGQTAREPRTFFKTQIGLADDQIAMIDRGKAVAKVLPSKTPAEIFIFGAVYVNAAPEEYVKLAFDMSRLRRLPSYLGVGRFSDPPKHTDLEGFTLEPDDIKNLKYCKPGKCGVQLPAEGMQQLQETVNWSGTDVSTQVNNGARKLALEVLRAYQEEGNTALGIYRDKDHPVHVAGQFQSLLSRSEVLPVYLPELNRYLLDYPNAVLTNVESLFYWERISFGLKPTLRLNHAIAYRWIGPKGATRVVAVKQLYASHYFQVALDLTACLPETNRVNRPGFYLITLKASRQEGLTGLKGSLLRRVVVGKTRAAQENALISIKRALEKQQ